MNVVIAECFGETLSEFMCVFATLAIMFSCKRSCYVVTIVLTHEPSLYLWCLLQLSALHVSTKTSNFEVKEE